MASLKDDFLLVAAIDFGTAYSGYAFSTRDDFKKDPLKVNANTWTAGSACLMSLKTSTCVLFDPQKKFHSFGYEAEDKYSDLSIDKKHTDWYFFRRFKMTLFDKLTLKRNYNLEGENGKQLPALDVFAASIGYLKKHLMKHCTDQIPDANDGDVRWVLTVPAIWNDASKQFMREAAEKAGIKKERLLISLEPEAASLCCRHLPMNCFQGCSSGFVPFAPKSKYLVFDAGGGTVDITVHEVQQSGSLKELYKANGGSWGGTYVDKSFYALLTEIITDDIMKQFSKEHTSDLIDLFREFEVKKRNFTNDMSQKVTFKVPNQLNKEFKRLKNMEIKDRIQTLPKYKDKITWSGDKMRMAPDIAQNLFNDACSSIANHLEKLFQDEFIKEVPTILMVGGFSESPLLQEEVKKYVKGKRIIIPADPGLAVLKGAVIFGHDPSAIAERRCRFTYGVDSCETFNSAIHPESKKIVEEGQELCTDIFSKHVEMGQPVIFGESQVTKVYTPISSDQKKMSIPVVASSDTSPMFTSEANCTRIGTLSLDLPGSGMDRQVNVRLIFSGTELEVEALEEKTGKKSTAKFDFLG